VMGMAPLRSMFQAMKSIKPEFLPIEVVIRNEKISLSSSKRPLEMFVKIVFEMTSIRLWMRTSAS